MTSATATEVHHSFSTTPSTQLKEGAESVTIFIVARVRLYREGLADLISRTTRYSVVGMSHRVAEVGALIHAVEPDIILVDTTAPHALSDLREFARAAPRRSILGLGVPNEEHTIVAFAEAGVSGFVGVNDSLTDLAQAVESVLRGDGVCSPRAAAALIRRVRALAIDSCTQPMDRRLTSREFEIIKLIDSGHSNRQIAQDLSIELSTVKNHVHNILEKLNVQSRSEAAARVRGWRGGAGHA